MAGYAGGWARSLSSLRASNSAKSVVELHEELEVDVRDLGAVAATLVLAVAREAVAADTVNAVELAKAGAIDSLL